MQTHKFTDTHLKRNASHDVFRFVIPAIDMETGGLWGSLASWPKQSKWYLKEHIRFPSGPDMLLYT